MHFEKISFHNFLFAGHEFRKIPGQADIPPGQPFAPIAGQIDVAIASELWLVVTCCSQQEKLMVSNLGRPRGKKAHGVHMTHYSRAPAPSSERDRLLFLPGEQNKRANPAQNRVYQYLTLHDDPFDVAELQRFRFGNPPGTRIRP